MTHPKIAIIGAGLSGLTLARQLQDVADVTLFEKSRGLGGRLSTRYTDNHQFDHGAQFFTARSDAFKRLVADLETAGIVARWDANFAEITGDTITHQKTWNADYPHYVGTPKMNQIGKYLADGLHVHRGVQIADITGQAGAWQLTAADGTHHGAFDWVALATPAEQASALLPASFAHTNAITTTRMSGCYTLMLGFDAPLDLPWQAALVKQADISWMSVDSSKPGRETKQFSLTVLATNAWADAHMEDDQDAVKAHLIAQAERVTGQRLQHATHADLHRWRYANCAKQVEDLVLCDDANQLAACGDWCIEGRVESAFTSALNLADRLRATF